MDAVYLFTGLALFLSLVHLIKERFSSGKTRLPAINLPPSPPSLPILGHLLHLKKPLHQSLARLSAAHGPILLLRFGTRPVLSVSSADLADDCFTTNDLVLATRPGLPTTSIASYDYTTIAAAAYGPGWREMRRVATVEALSGQRLSFFSNARTDEARALARCLFRDSSADGAFEAAVELRPRLFGLAMNVMTRMIAGKRYYGAETGEADAELFRESVEKVLATAGVSSLGDFLPPAIGWISRLWLQRRLAQIIRQRDEFMQRLIEEHRRKRREEEGGGGPAEKEKRSHRTVMDALLSMQEEQPKKYTDLFIKAMIWSLLAAGTDTTSNTVEWAMSALLNSPDKMEKAKEEIDDRIGHGRLLQESDLPSLPYLHCIINETLRRHPVAPLLLPHHSMDNFKLGGFDVPRGTMILVSSYVIHRDPKIWPEPTEFLPERFEEGKADAKKGMLPFGMGRRRCPGEALAVREMGLVLGVLIQCFEWRRVGEDEVSMEEGSGLTMPRAHPLRATCKPRACMITALSQL